MFSKVLKPVLLASMMATFLTGCGSSSSTSGVSGTTTVNKGVITGFGSVYVNGIKFETGQSTFSVDDNADINQDNLRVGMVVTIQGTVNADGTTGTASFIQYDNELKGPISAITDNITTKQITILSKVVTVNADTVFDSDFGLSFNTLAVDDVVEVSGLVTATGITATHIEKQGIKSTYVGKIEILGNVASLTGSSLSDFTFNVDGLAIMTTSNTKLDDLQLANIADGAFVKVKGTLDALGTTLTATKIKAKNYGLGNDDVDKADVEGVISNFNSTDNTFDIQGQTVDASQAVFLPSSIVLVDGLTVEAEGALKSGVLIAKKIKQKGNKIKLKANVTGIDLTNGSITFTFNSIDVKVRVNTQTKLEDDRDNLNPFNLSDLAIDDTIELKAYDDGTTTINAFELKRKISDKIKIQSAVKAFDSVNKTVTLLGVSFDLSAANFNTSTTSVAVDDNFFNQLSVGEFVKLVDSDSDGVIDTVEMED